MEEGLIHFEIIMVELLLVISLVALLVQRWHVPYTVALVGTGLLISVLQPQIEELTGPIVIELTPELILAIFVPPLIFEAAFNLDFDTLRRDLPAILLLAVPGVIVTMLIVGGMVALTTGLAIPVALVFGALIAATDPVAVIALFRTLGVPKRLGVLVEGESLLNDGTAIVVFGSVLSIALVGEFSPVGALVDFVRVIVGGMVVGFALGRGAAWIIARVDNHLIETTLTTTLAFGVFLVAEQMHFSGVLAVVVAGLINGGLSSEGMEPTTRIILYNFWEYVAFLANSFLFLLIGLEVNITALIAAAPAILWAILAVLLARTLVVYISGWLTQQLFDPIPASWQHVFAWGGLRGAISLALVLSLPSLGGDRETLVTITFGVVLFTVFVQGTTIELLLRRLGVISLNEIRSEYERKLARLVSLQEAKERVRRLFQKGAVSPFIWDKLLPEIDEQITQGEADLRGLLDEHPELADFELNIARAEVLRAQRSALLDLRRSGAISEDVFEDLTVVIDEALTELN